MSPSSSGDDLLPEDVERLDGGERLVDERRRPRPRGRRPRSPTERLRRLARYLLVLRLGAPRAASSRAGFAGPALALLLLVRAIVLMFTLTRSDVMQLGRACRGRPARSARRRRGRLARRAGRAGDALSACLDQQRQLGDVRVHQPVAVEVGVEDQVRVVAGVVQDEVDEHGRDLCVLALARVDGGERLRLSVGPGLLGRVSRAPWS